MTERTHPALSGGRLIAAVGAWLVASIAVVGATVLASRALAPGWARDPNTVTPVLVAEVYAALIAASAIALRPVAPRARRALATTVRDVGLAVLACAAVYLVTGLLQGLLAPRSWRGALAILAAMGADDGRLATASPLVAGVIVLRACVLAPLGEELLFRGALYTWLRGRWSAPTAIAVSAAMFALIHGFPAILPLAFALGVGFGWVRERTGSIVPGVIVHAAHNAAMLAVSYALTGWTARLPQWGGS